MSSQLNVKWKRNPTHFQARQPKFVYVVLAKRTGSSLSFRWKKKHNFSVPLTNRWHNIITVFYHFTNVCWSDVFGLHHTTTTDINCFRSSFFSSFSVLWSHLLYFWCMILINNMKNGWLNDATFYVDNIDNTSAHLIGRHTCHIAIYLPNFVTIRNVVSSRKVLLNSDSLLFDFHERHAFKQSAGRVTSFDIKNHLLEIDSGVRHLAHKRSQ